MTTDVRPSEPVIAGAMLPFRGSTHDELQHCTSDVWRSQLDELASLGFSAVDLTDSWVRPGDLTSNRLDELVVTIADAGLTAPAISAIRRSVIDPQDGVDNLAYSHRTIDAASALGCSIVSVGLHRPLTERQREVLWFWTVDGSRDADDPETFALAVSRLRELGDHAQSVGVDLSLEMYEDTLLGSAESAVRLVEAIGLDNVGLNPDIGNLVRQQCAIDDIAETHERCLPYANYWHMKNYLRFESPDAGTALAAPSNMENGVINYRRAVSDGAAVGFRGPYCIEQYGGDMLTVMATNLGYLEVILDRRDDGGGELGTGDASRHR